MPLINCKIYLELNWNKNCVLSSTAGERTFKITTTRLHVPIVPLSTKDNVKLTKKLNEGFKRPVYWNEYKTKIRINRYQVTKLQDFILMLLFKELKDF